MLSNRTRLIRATSAWVAAMGLTACGDDDPARISTTVENRYAVASVDASVGAPDSVDAPDSIDTQDSIETPESIDPVDTTRDDTAVVPGDTAQPADTGPAGDTSNPNAGGPTRYLEERIHSPLTAAVVDNLRAIRAVDPALADDVFMKVGASTTVGSSFLKCLSDDRSVDLGIYGDLQPVLDYFRGGDAGGSDPFARSTLAAKVGVSAIWAISGDPSPLEEEYLATDPRFALVAYGSNDMQLGTTFQSALWGFGKNLWTLVDDLLAWGVIPVLNTIGHRLDISAADEWVPTYNAVIRGLAQGRQIPLLDMFLAYEDLPNYGISGDGLHGTVYSGGACRFTEEGLEHALNTRNLQTLMTLERLMAAVLEGQVLDDEPGPPLGGAGTLDDPYRIDTMPFSDLRSTADSTSRRLDVYGGCDSAANESGPERIYRFEVDEPMRIRAFVHDRDGVDIDIHLLDQSASESGCIERAHRIIEADLSPGRYHFVLDTFVSNGVELSGEYLFTLLRLD